MLQPCTCRRCVTIKDVEVSFSSVLMHSSDWVAVVNEIKETVHVFPVCPKSGQTLVGFLIDYWDN